MYTTVSLDIATHPSVAHLPGVAMAGVMSTSWVRPTEAPSIGMPSTLYYTGSHSSLGVQVRRVARLLSLFPATDPGKSLLASRARAQLKSNRQTAVAHSIPTSEYHRNPSGLPRCVARATLASRASPNSMLLLLLAGTT